MTVGKYSRHDNERYLSPLYIFFLLNSTKKCIFSERMVFNSNLFNYLMMVLSAGCIRTIYQNIECRFNIVRRCYYNLNKSIFYNTAIHWINSNNDNRTTAVIDNVFALSNSLYKDWGILNLILNLNYNRFA